MAEASGELLLSPYRVLDLTDGGSLLCGKILADLGADVIQVEPPGGSPSRQIGPFYKDEVHPEKSLFWWAYTANKRSITLDLHASEGQIALKRLVKGSHFLIESSPPGQLDGLGLGYAALNAINPALVMVSITPFGKDGPFAHYRAPDIVGMALGGFMHLTGDSDRPPLRVGAPQFYLHGAAAGGAGALIAHAHRALTGEGQHVDVSCHQAVARSLAHAPQSWDLEGVVLERMGVYRHTAGEAVVRINWRCKDGYVNYMLQGGALSSSTRSMLAWMDEEGLGDEYLKSVNWEALGYGQVSTEVMQRADAPLERFLTAHTKEELTQESLRRRILLFPVATPRDILTHPQLRARSYFKALAHPELGCSVTYPSAFVRDEGGERVGLRSRPPLVGEHNAEILQGKTTAAMKEPVVAPTKLAGPTSGRPLEGLKVLDFCWVVVGPMTTKYLAEYGATVLRVESVKRPEVLRTAAPFKDGVSGMNRSGYFANNNPNKYGITIDMRHARAKELVLQMVSWADLVTENFTPGTMESWGLDYGELKRVNPGIVLFSTSMLGRGGPMERQPGFGPVLSSLAGLTHFTGWPDRDPVNPYGAYTDFIVPRFAVASILAALDYRRRTGRGMHLDMSQLEASIQFSSPFLLDCAVNDRELGRMGNRDPAASPHGAYPCVGEDRWIAIACPGEREWLSMRSVIDPGGGDWPYWERFCTLAGRKANEDELDRLVGDWTGKWDARELMVVLQGAGVPAGMVNDPRDLFDDPQLKHRGHFQFLDHPEIGRYASDRSEFNLPLTPGSLDRPAPLMGQHTEYVLREIVGLSEEEYQSLKADEVLE